MNDNFKLFNEQSIHYQAEEASCYSEDFNEEWFLIGIRCAENWFIKELKKIKKHPEHLKMLLDIINNKSNTYIHISNID